MEGGGQADGGRNKVDGMVEGAGVRKVEGDWRADGCRSQAEITDGRAGNRPSRVAVRNSSDLSVIYFCSNQFSSPIQLKEHVGVAVTCGE